VPAEARGRAAPVRADHLLSQPDRHRRRSRQPGRGARRHLEGRVRRARRRAPAGAAMTLGAGAAWASLDERNAASRAAVRDLGAAGGAAGLRAVARDVRETRLPKLDDERFVVVVLGEFNHGKSPFTNARLGKAVLRAGTPPPAAVLTHLSHGARAT